MELPEDEVITLKDELIVDGYNVQVRGIETRGGKRPSSAEVPEIKTLWAKMFEENSFNIKLKKKNKAVFKRISVVVDEEFEVGDLIEVDGSTAVITGIKLDDDKIIKRGTAQARYIKVVYAREVNRPRHF